MKKNNLLETKKELMNLLKQEIDYHHKMILNNFNQIDNKIVQLILINFGILSLFTSFIFPTFNNFYGLSIYMLILSLFFCSLINLLITFYPKKIPSLDPLILLTEYQLSQESELERAIKEISTSKVNSYKIMDKITKEKTKSFNLSLILIVGGLFFLTFYSLIKFYYGII